MTTIIKNGGRASSTPVGLALGGLASIGVTLALAAILSWLVVSRKIRQDQIGYWVMMLLVTASFAGAKVSYGKIKRQRLLVSLLSGAVYLAILISGTALFFGGQYSGVLETALMVFCGAGLSVLLKKSTKTKRRRGIRKYGYR